jgi:hypothetical protein
MKMYGRMEVWLHHVLPQHSPAALPPLKEPRVPMGEWVDFRASLDAKEKRNGSSPYWELNLCRLVRSPSLKPTDLFRLP